MQIQLASPTNQLNSPSHHHSKIVMIALCDSHVNGQPNSDH
jgi:hypothetical protein